MFNVSVYYAYTGNQLNGRRQSRSKWRFVHISVQCCLVFVWFVQGASKMNAKNEKFVAENESRFFFDA